jgi:UDP-N-acetylglucosamine--N-acetylmuramyl-(pentapeptide) pyrophosphoryl-undecaprenol N-acetylglucosamine transferase
MNKRVLIAAGGTGGHLFPALGLAKELTKENPHTEILFAAAGLDTNSFFNRQDYQFRTFAAGAFPKRSPWQCLMSCQKNLSGIWQSKKILAQFAPHVVIGFGSYHTFPLLFAARMCRYPFFLHEQNSKPGKVIRYFSKNAQMTGVFFPQAQTQLQGTVSLLTMPLREGYSKQTAPQAEGFEYFGLGPHKSTLLVFGGSQGAQALNQLVASAVSLMKDRNFQMLHFTGDESASDLLREHYSRLGVPAVVKTFEPHMKHAWSIADLAIARAGAGTIAEQMEFEVPAILIPYPYASENHQDSNADFIAHTVSGGWKFRQSEIHPEAFSAFLCSILNKENCCIQEKKTNLHLYKHDKSLPSFAEVITRYLKSL